MAREYDAAIQRYRQSLERFPDWDYTYYLLGQAYSLDGQHDAAIGAASRAINLTTDPVDAPGYGNWSAGLAAVLARAGREQAARDTLASIDERADPTRLAIAHVALGETDAALRYLDRAVAIRSPFLSELGDPAYDTIRDDPRFQAIVREAESPR
jgi:tetratricopeptide (TPR) repeat protein